MYMPYIFFLVFCVRLYKRKVGYDLDQTSDAREWNPPSERVVVSKQSFLDLTDRSPDLHACRGGAVRPSGGQHGVRADLG